MRLAEHPDFAAFLTEAATESELPETFVEKDYWITEILRTIATTLGERLRSRRLADDRRTRAYRHLPLQLALPRA